MMWTDLDKEENIILNNKIMIKIIILIALNTCIPVNTTLSSADGVAV
jgi:hypothetical protein